MGGISRQGTRIDGEDPYKSAEVQDVAEPSPIGKDEVTKTFTIFKLKQDSQAKQEVHISSVMLVKFL